MSTKPNTGDLTCVLSVCSRLIAQVDCITYILQGTTACIDIQLFSADGTPLDLSRFSNIQVLLFDDLDCTVANSLWPAVSGSSSPELKIMQYETTAGEIMKAGQLQVCLRTEDTGRPTGSIFAEIRLTEANTGEPDQVYGIKCIWVAVIQESKIWQHDHHEDRGLSAS